MSKVNGTQTVDKQIGRPTSENDPPSVAAMMPVALQLRGIARGKLSKKTDKEIRALMSKGIL